jgi:hypothetical protein
VGLEERTIPYKSSNTDNLARKIFLCCINELCVTRGRDSSISIAICYGLDGPGIESRWGPTQLPIHEYQVFPGVKRPGRGVDHPPHLAPRLKKEYSYDPLPLLVFVACSRVNLTFTFIVRYNLMAARFYKLPNLSNDRPRKKYAT